MAAITGRATGLTARIVSDQEVGARMTGEGVFLVDQLGGRYSERCYRGKVSCFSVAAQTIPVNGNNLVSVCGIYNPPGSGMVLEMIDTAIATVVATTVVDGYGWYSSTAALSALATFTTLATARSRRMQDPVSSVARVYSAVTHSGTPSLEAIIGSNSATTSTSNQATYMRFEGGLMIPPGILASIAATTAAAGTSGSTIMFSWADIPA